MSDSRPTPWRILQLATGAWAAGIVGAAVSYSLFAHPRRVGVMIIPFAHL